MESTGTGFLTWRDPSRPLGLESVGARLQESGGRQGLTGDETNWSQERVTSSFESCPESDLGDR